jgi:hypothetical protein
MACLRRLIMSSGYTASELEDYDLDIKLKIRLRLNDDFIEYHEFDSSVISDETLDAIFRDIDRKLGDLYGQ